MFANSVPMLIPRSRLTKYLVVLLGCVARFGLDSRGHAGALKGRSAMRSAPAKLPPRAAFLFER